MKLSIITSIAVASTLVASQTTKLETVVVTATKTEQNLKDVTSNISVITKEDIKERRYTTVTEALNSISGLNFTTNGGLGQATSLKVRGMDSKRVLVLIDGIRYNDSTSLSGANFSNLLITNIKQIEVIKGAQSGIWGADASAGVINIITNSAKEGFSGNLLASTGSFKTNILGGTLNYKADNYYINLNANNLKTDGFTAKAPRGVDIDTLEDDRFKSRTTSIKAGYILNNNRVDISHTIIDSNSDYDSPYGGTPIQQANNKDYSAKSKETFSSINFEHINSLSVVNIFAKQSKFDRESGNTGNISEFDGEVTEYGFTSTSSYNKDDFFIIGADRKTFSHANDINKEYKNNGIFISNNNKFSDGNTIITESLRYDKYDTFNNKTTGKIGIKHFYTTIKDFVASANYGTSYNVPTLYNLYNKPTWKIVNPENTKSYDITLEYNKFKATYFKTKISDMIVYKNWTDGYENLNGTSTIKGYELEYNTNITDNTLITLAYTKLSAKDKDGFDLQRRAKETLKANIDYYGISKLHLGIGSKYIGDRIEYTYGTHDISAKTGNYTLFNFVSNYEINDKTTVYLKVDNIGNKYYQSINGYATSPRAFYVGIDASF